MHERSADALFFVQYGPSPCISSSVISSRVCDGLRENGFEVSGLETYRRGLD